jgi:small subunit ribosomal protein S5
VSERVGEKPKSDYIEKVIKVNRVAKVVKGGRRFSFNALVVVGDGKGRVGYALGKANEVAEAVRKGVERASKAMKRVVIQEGRTIPHQVTGHFGASRLIMKPAVAGKGVIAAGCVRAVMECAGVHDISAKRVGSANPHNLIKAALDGLFQLRSHEDAALRRGVPIESIVPAKS